MPPLRPCIECRRPTRNGPRCEEHAVAWGANRDPAQHREHYGGDWPEVSAEARAEWIATHGYVCPGWGVPPHPSRDLTADHIVKASEGGTPTRDNVRILCRGCNTRRAVTEMNEGRKVKA